MGCSGSKTEGTAPVSSEVSRKSVSDKEDKPDAAADIPGDDDFVWQFQQDDGTWQQYDTADVVALQAAYASTPYGIAQLEFGAKRLRYEIDFSAMEQRNLGTGKVRQLRRELAHAGVAPPAGGYEEVVARQCDGHPTVALRESPPDGKILVYIMTGTKVSLLCGESGDYVEVKVNASGQVGWARRANFHISHSNMYSNDVSIEKTERTCQDIKTYYTIDAKPFARGSFGRVSLARDKKSEKQCAAKSIAKLLPSEVEKYARLPEMKRQAQRRNVSMLKQEVALMKALHHTNIMQLLDTFEDTQYLWLVMEYCEGGEMLDFIIAQPSYNESDVAAMMLQVFAAVNYIHANNVCHRDLKPANLLFLTKDEFMCSTLKVCDFGLACAFTPGQDLREICGTPYFMSPQMYDGRYDNTADLWSCGVIMFLLLCGYPPFVATGSTGLRQIVKRGNYSFDPAVTKGVVSEDAKALTRRLLTYASAGRMTSEEATSHEWLCSNRADQGGDLKEVQRKLAKFQAAERRAATKEKPS